MLKIDRENVVVDLFTGALAMTLTGPRPPNLPLRTAYSPAAPLTTDRVVRSALPLTFSLLMDRLPVDHFPSDSSNTSPFPSSTQPTMPPASQASFRTSDEPDPFKISFLKGPKRKRLAKVCIPSIQSIHSCLLTALSIPSISDRLVTPAIKANVDVTVLVRLPLFPACSRPDCASSAL